MLSPAAAGLPIVGASEAPHAGVAQRRSAGANGSFCPIRRASAATLGSGLCPSQACESEPAISEPRRPETRVSPARGEGKKVPSDIVLPNLIVRQLRLRDWSNFLPRFRPPAREGTEGATARPATCLPHRISSGAPTPSMASPDATTVTMPWTNPRRANVISGSFGIMKRKCGASFPLVHSA